MTIGTNNSSENKLPIRETLKDVLNEILERTDKEIHIDELTGDMSLTEDLGLDSLDLAEMTVRLEDIFGVDVFEDEVVDEVNEVLEKLDK